MIWIKDKFGHLHEASNCTLRTVHLTPGKKVAAGGDNARAAATGTDREIELQLVPFGGEEIVLGSFTEPGAVEECLRRFEDALRVFPANKLAAPVGAYKDLQDVEDTTNDYNPDDTSQWAYSIKKGALFLNDADTRASVSWDASQMSARTRGSTISRVGSSVPSRAYRTQRRPATTSAAIRSAPRSLRTPATP